MASETLAHPEHELSSPGISEVQACLQGAWGGACWPCEVTATFRRGPVFPERGAYQPPQEPSEESTGNRAWIQAPVLTKLDLSGPR